MGDQIVPKLGVEARRLHVQIGGIGARHQIAAQGRSLFVQGSAGLHRQARQRGGQGDGDPLFRGLRLRARRFGATTAGSRVKAARTRSVNRLSGSNTAPDLSDSLIKQ